MDELPVMKKISYTESFKKAVEFSKNNSLFLGSGNPNAKLLFIGKEAAIDKQKSNEQYEQEYAKNVTDWEHNLANNTQLMDVANWLTDSFPQFNSLYPYKGQRNTINRKKKIGDQIIYNGGTSKTWHNYQKIIDSLYFDGTPSEFINFHEHTFCSEFNQETGKYSKDVPREKREESINKRKDLFEKQFFKDFPITIVAVGHYVRDFDINLQEIFKVTYAAEISKQHSEGLKNEYINVHYDNFENPTRLLIHTNQLSMVSNELVQRLGEICKAFLLR